MADDSFQLPVLGYALEDIPKMTSGVVSPTRVFEDLAKGRLRAKKVGKRDIITPEEAQRACACGSLSVSSAHPLVRIRIESRAMRATFFASGSDIVKLTS